MHRSRNIFLMPIYLLTQITIHFDYIQKCLISSRPNIYRPAVLMILSHHLLGEPLWVLCSLVLWYLSNTRSSKGLLSLWWIRLSLVPWGLLWLSFSRNVVDCAAKRGLTVPGWLTLNTHPYGIGMWILAVKSHRFLCVYYFRFLQVIHFVLSVCCSKTCLLCGAVSFSCGRDAGIKETQSAGWGCGWGQGTMLLWAFD